MKTNTLLLALLFSFLLLISCHKDKDQDAQTNSSRFAYDGKDYPLDKGYIHNEVGTRFTVAFFSSGITANQDNGMLFPHGSGSGIILCLDSKIPTELSLATYYWPAQTTPGSEMICGGSLGMNNNLTSDIFGTFRSASYGDGTITVLKSGSEYTIHFSIVVGGKTASGKYIGTLVNY